MQTKTSNTLHNAIMEAGSKDRPPMLAPGNYVQWKSIIKRYIDTKPNHELIHYCLKNPPYKFTWVDKEVPISEGIDNDIYSTVDACPNAFNEIRAERIARTANPLALVAQQQPVYHPQNHPTHYTQNSSTRSQQAATRNRGKAIVNSPQPIYDQESSMVAEDDETSQQAATRNRGKAIVNSPQPIYDQESSMVAEDDETIGNVAEARETVEQADWRDDTDDDLEDQELEAHYMYMAQLQKVTPDAANSGLIFDAEPLQKVSNDDHYNVFAIESKHPEQSESIHDTIEQDKHNVIIDSLDMSYDREHID
uniref:Uncharacterized protein n=1 Tax=Tanacetum cinerariifolium TaxID=118510 RepID=A0A6L2LZX4_TANCI|nr:hypothetical protein [Tanacetum cinerariifolium]